ncbi:pilus assembly PilX family protein [Modicisalibacter xianhensis]|nr:hypothetical protein [Halomonas xianhensis]
MQQQKGAALLVSLVFLTVALMLGLSSFQLSRLEEAMAGNQRMAALSLMAAEYGASRDEVLALPISDGSFIASCVPSHERIEPAVDIASSESYAGPVISYQYELACYGSEITVLVHGAIKGRGDEMERIIAVQFESELLPAFTQGMLAHGNVTVNGGALLFGNVHSNSNVSVKIDAESVSNITAVGEAPVIGEGYENVTSSSGAEEKDVPLVSEFFDSSNVYNKVAGEDFVILDASDSSCDFLGSGDMGGKTYFCNGELTVSGSFNNVTLFANGNIDHNGASNLSDQQSVDVAMFSTGSIAFNGKNDAYGVFWADGDITQNGSSVIGGSMISGGAMTLNGGFTFISNSDISVEVVPSQVVRDSWQEVVST